MYPPLWPIYKIIVSNQYHSFFTCRCIRWNFSDYRNVANHLCLFHLFVRKRPDPKIGYFAPIFNTFIRLFHFIRTFHLDSRLFSSILVSHARWRHICSIVPSAVSSLTQLFERKTRFALESFAPYLTDISFPNTLDSSDNVLPFLPCIKEGS